MPLHDWAKLKGWSGVHLLWLSELVQDIKPKLPPGFRAYLGNSPMVAIDDPPGVPDVAVRQIDADDIGMPDDDVADEFEPDREVMLATLETDQTLSVEYGGRLIAAVELVSPGKKDGAKKRRRAVGRCLGYLTNGVHLLLVDVHPTVPGDSVADAIASGLALPDEPSRPPPFVVSYRIGQAVRGEGRYFAIRGRPLTAGQPLPPMPLAINSYITVPVDLEGTYMRAAANAYLT